MRAKWAVIKIMFYSALVLIGAGAGSCVRVFMARGVPVINGGGEIFLLLMLPLCLLVGFQWGSDYQKYRNSRRRLNECSKRAR